MVGKKRPRELIFPIDIAGKAYRAPSSVVTSTLRCIAVDPGKTTGWVVADGGRRSITVIAVGEARSVGEVEEVLDEYRPHVVVVEAYRLYPWRARAQFWSRMPSPEVIGALKSWCSRNNASYVEQPASAKEIITPTALKRFRLWEATRGRSHARDAARHLLYYLWNGGQNDSISRVLLDEKEGG